LKSLYFYALLWGYWLQKIILNLTIVSTKCLLISGNFTLEVTFCKGSSKSEHGSYSWFLSFFRSVHMSENQKILLPQKPCFVKQCIGQCVSEQLTSSPPHMSKLDSNLRHGYNKLCKVLRACPAAPIGAW
jgi:hypothetical protein